MPLYPTTELRRPLAEIFDNFSKSDFPSLRERLDMNFDDRYAEFWESQGERAKQTRFWRLLDKPVAPSSLRLKFDRNVSQVLGVPLTDDELMEIYGVIAKEIIITPRPARDSTRPRRTTWVSFAPATFPQPASISL